MFVFDRSAFAVVLPLALLGAVVLWSNRAAPQAPQRDHAVVAVQPASDDARVAANLPSR
jgi:hypothetical protein